MKIKLWDKDWIWDEKIGFAEVDITKWLEKGYGCEWVPLVMDGEPEGRLRIDWTFTEKS